MITNNELAEFLTPLVEYKNMTGYASEVFVIEDIEVDYPGDDLQEKIRIV